jgi:hypothetical protein
MEEPTEGASEGAGVVSEGLRANVQWSGGPVLSRRTGRPLLPGDPELKEMEARLEVLAGLRENVLLGVTLRRGLPPGVPAPTRPPRLINVTIRVDDLSLNYARGRAVVEGTSVSALVNRLMEEYSGISRPPGQEISRRIPMFRERRIRPVQGVDDL